MPEQNGRRYERRARNGTKRRAKIVAPMSATDDEIIRVARLMALARRDNIADNLSGKQLDRELRKLDQGEVSLAFFVSKVIEGTPFRIVSDSPDTVRRARAIVAYFGATVVVVEEGGCPAEITFAPALARSEDVQWINIHVRGR